MAWRVSPGSVPGPVGPRRLGTFSDNAIVALVGCDDEEALAELYDRYGDVAYRLATRVLRDAVLAEDAVQEAFLAVWHAADTFHSGRGTLRTWLLTLVHRRAVDLVRREQRLPRLCSAGSPMLRIPAGGLRHH